MHVTIFNYVLEQILDAGCHTHPSHYGYLFGKIVDDGEFVQITGASSQGEERDPIGMWSIGSYPEKLELPQKTDRTTILILVSPTDEQVKCYAAQGMEWHSVEYEIVHLFRDIRARLDGLFDTRYLADKTVTVIGIGTGGAMAALELAKNGVGHFRLVDFDRLSASNVARHVCGLTDIGRFKTRALADVLHNVNPIIAVEAFEFDVLRDREGLKNAVLGSDLVIAATDSEKSKRLINEVCWPLGIPSVYGAAYDRAFGGDVLRVIPPETACYECFYAQISGIFDTMPKKGEIDYSSDVSKVVAEPGLGIDVAFVGLILAKMALLTLLKGSESTLHDFPSDFVIWGNQPIWIFQKPLESLFVHVSPNPVCPVCQPEAYARKKLGLSQEEAHKLAREILDQLDAEDSISLADLKDHGLEKDTGDTLFP